MSTRGETAGPLSPVRSPHSGEQMRTDLSALVKERLREASDCGKGMFPLSILRQEALVVETGVGSLLPAGSIRASANPGDLSPLFSHVYCR